MSLRGQRGFPEWTPSIVESMSDGAPSVLDRGRGRSRKIAWNRGVEQRGPLSPLLTNLCIESLLQAVGDNLGRCGAFIAPPVAEERIGLTVQACSDDVVFVSRSAGDMETMLGKLEEFESWAGMEVNVDKCAIASFRIDVQGHRCGIEHPVQIRGQDIWNLT
jgi:hypothetical protein